MERGGWLNQMASPFSTNRSGLEPVLPFADAPVVHLRARQTQHLLMRIGLLGAVCYMALTGNSWFLSSRDVQHFLGVLSLESAVASARAIFCPWLGSSPRGLVLGWGLLRRRIPWHELRSFAVCKADKRSPARLKLYGRDGKPLGGFARTFEDRDREAEEGWRRVVSYLETHLESMEITVTAGEDYRRMERAAQNLAASADRGETLTLLPVPELADALLWVIAATVFWLLMAFLSKETFMLYGVVSGPVIGAWAFWCKRSLKADATSLIFSGPLGRQVIPWAVVTSVSISDNALKIRHNTRGRPAVFKVSLTSKERDRVRELAMFLAAECKRRGIEYLDEGLTDWTLLSNRSVH